MREQRATLAGQQVSRNPTQHPFALPPVAVGAGNDQVGDNIAGNRSQLLCIGTARQGERRFCPNLVVAEPRFYCERADSIAGTGICERLSARFSAATPAA